MTLDQALAFGLVILTVAGFVWGRLPYDLIAIASLLAGIVLGLVPIDKAFSGFSDDVVVIVAAALIISTAVARSGFVETIMRPLMPYMKTARTQVPILVGATMLMSMVTKNIGALAIFMPVASQVAKRSGTSISRFLMPMSFASLIGGLVTLVGTSPNIIVSKIRMDVSGEPFRMFDYAPVGFGIALCGFVFLSLASGLLPKRKPASSLGASFALDAYTAEATVSETSAAAGRTVAEIQRMADDEITIRWVLRERFRRLVPAPDLKVEVGDILLIGGDPEDLERAVSLAGLHLSADLQTEHDVESETVVEGVVSAGSPVVDQTPGRLGLEEKHGVSLLAVSRGGWPISQRLASLRLRVGDVVVLKGTVESVPDALGALKILPLAERQIVLGRNRRSWVPIAVLAVAMLLTALGLANATMAFFGAAVVLLLLRVMSMNDAYHTVEASVIVLLAALIPVSEAIQTTGGTDLIAVWLSPVLHGLPPIGSLAVVILIAMAITPFLNNAATVLVMAPIAASVAQKLGLSTDAFLMGVALGAACDFLTPIGHQCNTIVMAPGGYRFGDYWRLGLPLSVIVVVVGTPLIAYFWPLGG
ncbi:MULTISPECIES: SLC13 family permease [unclassified Aureimonas]|uniref:SLC13 family permease n=1 Tax=unclassified Aureimonas TaxID=2615206 RepID=UPI0006F2A973|nr:MULTISPECIES: SLC13 family permease [unclassified Aureimonas]KQT53022.1 permease [Aureimonas sp. Leaf427]KQT80478.1 permease [Aureimonas sp. Leaf460]